MPFIDIALVIQLFENLLYLFLMIVICGTNELVIGLSLIHIWGP